MGFSLTPVTALAHGQSVPDVALGALLGAHEFVAGCFLWHTHWPFLSRNIYVAGCHTASITTNIGTAFFKRFTLLKDKSADGELKK